MLTLPGTEDGAWWQAKNISRQTESRMARLLYHIKPKCELIFPKEETLWMMYSTAGTLGELTV